MWEPQHRLSIPSPVWKHNPKKSQTIVHLRTTAIKHEELREKLARLTAVQFVTSLGICSAQPASDASDAPDQWIDVDMDNWTSETVEKDIVIEGA